VSTLLRFEELIVRTASERATFPFDSAPVTVITGPVGTGKSSLLMLAKHATGGDATLPSAVRRNVQEVGLRVRTSAGAFELWRRIQRDTGTVRVVPTNEREAARDLPIRPRAEEQTISNFLMSATGLPIERIPRRSRGATSATVGISFQDLYGYVYVQAKEIDRSVVGHLDQFKNKKRIALFEIMFGLTDPELLELQRRAGQLNEDILAAQTEAATVRAFLEAAGTENDEDLVREYQALAQALHEADKAFQALRSDIEDLASASRDIQHRLSSALEQATRAANAARIARETADGRRALVAQLRLDLDRAERSASASGILTAFTFATCPRCAQRLDTRPVASGHCVVCTQPDPEVSPEAVSSATARLREQLADAQGLLQEDERSQQEAEDAAREAELFAAQQRHLVDRQTRSTVAPRFDAIADISANQAALNARMKAIADARQLWRRLGLLDQRVTDLKSERAAVGQDVASREALLAGRRARVDELSGLFAETLERLELPWSSSARIDTETYLPIVNETKFEELQASGGGLSTTVNVAYHIALLTYALDHTDVLLPSMVIIDSPRKNIGNGPQDAALASRIYSRLLTLQDAYQSRVQMILADNDVPQGVSSNFNRIEFDYDNPMVPGAEHPGADAVERVEEL
jgi:hypothetical protein